MYVTTSGTPTVTWPLFTFALSTNMAYFHRRMPAAGPLFVVSLPSVYVLHDSVDNADGPGGTAPRHAVLALHIAGVGVTIGTHLRANTRRKVGNV